MDKIAALLARRLLGIMSCSASVRMIEIQRLCKRISENRQSAPQNGSLNYESLGGIEDSWGYIDKTGKVTWEPAK
jgi:hypothetical protein